MENSEMSILTTLVFSCLISFCYFSSEVALCFDSRLMQLLSIGLSCFTTVFLLCYFCRAILLLEISGLN